jgi:RNA polymerase sigma-70 factor (ECF subfamily)
MPDRPASADGPEQELAVSEEAARVRALLPGLPPQQRAVVILRVWQDLSFREIASALALAEGTVKAHYFFALRNLRRKMEVL